MRQLKISKSITNRGSSSLDRYLAEIKKEDLITAEEEVRLARLVKQGDVKALDKLVKANLRFVVSVAKQYQNQGLSLPDLINEGNLGLIKATKRFDETRGFKLISYAVWWIRQSILQALAEQARIVRLPLNKIGLLNKINKATTKLEQELNREPDTDEIALLLEIDPEDIEKMRREALRDISLDAPVANQSDTNHISVLDTIEDVDQPMPDQRLMNESLRTELTRSVNTLTERERTVLILYYALQGGKEFTLEEIGATLDLTRERVRQIKEKAIRRLKHTSRSKHLKQYVG